jgi:hypothetical protein
MSHRCSFDGCKKTATRKKRTMCEAHYYQIRRTGSHKTRTVKGWSTTSHGYIVENKPSHPLSGATGHVYMHRRVYYDAHGPGPFQCHWCSTPLGWDALHIDHIDENKKNNTVSNLVPSCCVCNTARGRWKSKQKWRAKFGLTFDGVTLTPNEWAEKIGISRTSLLLRLESGWPLEKAMTAPRGTRGPKRGGGRQNGP